MQLEEFDNNITFFAEVILPLSLPKNYTYGIPKEFETQVAIGKRVEIQFGQRKIYAGLIKRLHHVAPIEYRIKPIISVLDAAPIVSETQLKFWEWMAQYYLCAEGDVMNAALPSGFKLESETSIILHPNFNDDFTNLNDKEYVVAEALTIQKELTIEEIAKILHRKTVYPIIDSLLKKNVVIVKENLIERYKPRIETFIKLNPEFSSDNKLRVLFDELEKKAKKQLNVLMSYLHFNNQKTDYKNSQRNKFFEIEKSELLEKSKSGNAALNSLIKKNIFIAEKKEVDRIGNNENEVDADFELAPSQKIALEKIKSQFGWVNSVAHQAVRTIPVEKRELEGDKSKGLNASATLPLLKGKLEGVENNKLEGVKNVLLLHGITGSGKTNLYIRLIEETIEKEKQILYLLPEIALTSQIVGRLRKKFGNKIGIYHSRFNEQERVEIWNKLLHGEYQIVLGARSAIFLPFENLGLVIVDEEHDSSYKQNDPAPRYHGRDAAIYLASLFAAKTILGSATPSLESFLNAQQDKFGFAELNERFGNASLPEII
ncbi:MAG: DEAD/DEAH box helicase, partial [Chitinophagales bacterium]|nr:DEAD/DEAH box helicase [Chitinophagales bacterium]